MENQKVMLFRQRNRWGMTVLSVLLCLIISPFISMAAMLPQVLAVVPVLMLMLLGYVGPVSAVICAGLTVGAGSTFFGVHGAFAALVLFVPVLVVSAVLVEKRLEFWKSAAIAAATMFISMGVVVGVLTVITGSDVVTAFTQAMRSMFDLMGTLSDSLLLMFAQMGVYVPEGLDLSAAPVALTPEIREEMINAIVYVMDTGLRLELPAQMTTGALTAGVLGQAMLRKGVLRRGVDVPYPRLHTWRLPKGWGRILCGTLLLFYVLANMTPLSMNTALYVFSTLFDTVFVVQGIAAICYLLHKNGKGRIFKLVVCVLCFAALQSIMLGVGIADQAIDITRRRQELDKDEQPYNPFGQGPED